jgi:hypothetical protein
MLPYATPAIAAQLDPYEERERDTLRTPARRHLGSPARARARIALAICEVEAGLRSPLQLEQRCHLTLWPKLAQRLRRSGGRRCRSGACSEWWPKSTSSGWPRSRCWSAGAVGWCRWRCGWTAPRAAGGWSSSNTDRRRVWRGPSREGLRQPGPLPTWP